MKKTKASAICLIITVISFLGFLVENIWLAFTKGFIDNRNMILPFLLGYGLAVTVIYLLFGTPRSPRLARLSIATKNKWLNFLIYFGIVFVIITVGEMLLGLFVEHAFGIVWWNYTRLPLNITKYTSVPTSFAFTLMITIFMQYIYVPLYKRFEGINKKLLFPLAIILMSLMTLDFIHSGIRMALDGEVYRIWQIYF